MNRMIILGGFGVCCAALLGVGVSLAHSAGFFSPSQPDWLEVSRQTPVIVPDVQPSRGDVAIQTAPAVLSAPNVDTGPVPVIAVTPQATQPRALAPDLSVSPVIRPDRSTTPTVAFAPSTPDLAAPLSPSQRVSTRSAPGLDLQGGSEAAATQRMPTQTLLAPPDVARTTADPVDNVWLLGVFR